METKKKEHGIRHIAGSKQGSLVKEIELKNAHIVKEKIERAVLIQG